MVEEDREDNSSFLATQGKLPKSSPSQRTTDNELIWGLEDPISWQLPNMTSGLAQKRQETVTSFDPTDSAHVSHWRLFQGFKTHKL